MYTHLLIATDGSEIAQKGVDHGLSLARQLGARATIINVSEPFPSFATVDGMPGMGLGDEFYESYRQASRESAARILGEARKVAEGMGVKVKTLHVEAMRPAEAIVATADEQACDLIVMASHGRRGIGRLFLGSQTVETLTHSRVPVLVVR